MIPAATVTFRDVKKLGAVTSLTLLVGLAAAPANAEPPPTPTGSAVQQLQPGLTSVAATALAMDARDTCNAEMAEQILGGHTDWNAYFKERGANEAVAKLLADYTKSCRVA